MFLANEKAKEKGSFGLFKNPAIYMQVKLACQAFFLGVARINRPETYWVVGLDTMQGADDFVACPQPHRHHTAVPSRAIKMGLNYYSRGPLSVVTMLVDVYIALGVGNGYTIVIE